MARNGNKPIRALDALALLKADHDKVRALFGAYNACLDSGAMDEDKADIVDQICEELMIHSTLEEQVFYPVLRSAAGAEGAAALDDAEVEHASARELIGQLSEMYPDDVHYDATVAVLGEETRSHIDAEEDVLFAAARSAGLDLALLAGQLIERRRQLQHEAGERSSHLNGAQVREPMAERRAQRSRDE